MTQEDFLSNFPTQAQVEAVIAELDSQDANTRKNMDQRMMNYYNCIDDYSYGGICDKVASESLSANRFTREMLKAQLANGKPLSDVAEVNVLCDLEVNVVSDRIVNGRFGLCWIIDNGNGNVSFVGLAKKASTYAKKGYVVKVKQYFYDQYISRTGKHSLFVTDQKIVESDNVSYPSTYLNKALWLALNIQ